MKKNALHFVILGISTFISGIAVAAAPVFSIVPTQRAPSIIYPGETVTAVYQITNNTPYTLNGNGLVNLQNGVTQTGGSCSMPFFNLLGGASCTVNLQITADELVGNVVRGPETCHTPQNRVYCSIPSAGNELNVVKSSIAPTATTLSVSLYSAAPAVIDVSGTGVTLSIQNTGTTTAYNVIYTLPSGWAGVSAPGNCGNIAPSDTCLLTFSATQPNITNFISFSALNAPVVQSPAIAFSFDGGLVFSVSGTSPSATAKVVMTSDLVNDSWDPGANCPPNGASNSCTTISWTGGTSSSTNGSVNTIDIVTSIGNSNPNYAAYQCHISTADGATAGEWYLPAICELGDFPSTGAPGCGEDNINSNLYFYGW
jgi:hypothetical protein